MRTRTDQVRLRTTALILAGAAACLLLCSAAVALQPLSLGSWALGAGALALAMGLLGAAISFWRLSGDTRAGVVVDGKGLLLNLGAYSAFISWANIERVGVTWHCTDVFALGSVRKLGIALHNPIPFIQSYEERTPHAPLATEWLLRRLQRAMGASSATDRELEGHLMACRHRTGFDVLIPEALLGQRPEVFAALIEQRRRPASVPDTTPAWAS